MIEKMELTEDQFLELMKEVGEGCEEAIGELVETYGDHVFRVVRSRLNRKLRASFDSADFYQAVWASFFAGRYSISHFTTSNQLVRFLETVAANKVIDETRRRLESQKRGVQRENSVHLEDDGGDARLDLAGDSPTPSQIVVAHEQEEWMLDQLPAHFQGIVRLRTQGFTLLEIASQTGCSERSVRRVIERLHLRIQE